MRAEHSHLFPPARPVPCWAFVQNLLSKFHCEVVVPAYFLLFDRSLWVLDVHLQVTCPVVADLPNSDSAALSARFLLFL